MPSNIFKRGRVYWVRYQGGGKDARKSLRTTSKSVARQRAREWLTEIEEARWSGTVRVTYREAVEHFVAEYLPGAVKPSAAKRYMTSLRQLHPHFEALWLDQIDRRGLSAFVTARKAGGASNATVRRDLACLSRICSLAVNQGWLQANPVMSFDKSVVPERRKPIVYPTRKEIDALVDAAPAMFGKLIRFASQTGMRQGEIVSLTWDQVRGREVLLTETKSGRPRVVPLSNDAQGTLEGTVRHISSPVVFHHDGEPFRGAHHQFWEIRKRVGIAWRFHDLRHFYASEFLRRNPDLFALQRILGHSNIRTTMLYVHLLPGHLQEAVGTISGTP